MRRFYVQRSWILPGALLLCAAALTLLLVLFNQEEPTHTTQARSPASPTQATASQKPLTQTTGSLLSQNITAYASSGYTPASQANDGSYDTTWRSQGSQSWLAYDLSSLSPDQRQQILVVWYNETLNYDHTLIKYEAYNLPENYTLEVNAGAGGQNPPATGWKTLVTVTGNHYHSRQHVLNLARNNWLRMHITTVDGSAENFDTSINMDIYAAHSALADDWMFYGDSITAGGMGQITMGDAKAFWQLINQHLSTQFPVQESGGIGYLTSLDGAMKIGLWLPLFPGHYVGLSYGTNDALGCVDPTAFYNNYVVMIQTVIAAGKVPVIPHIPWGKAPNIQRCAPGLNARIDALYKQYPAIIKGPDFWSYFQAHPNLISSDNIHPTVAGFGAYRQQWAATLLKEVYQVR